MIAAVGIGVAAVSLASPPMIDSSEERSTTVLDVDGETSAVVTGETTLYEDGTRLRDRSVYLRSATPNLTVRTTARPDGADEVDQRLALVYRAERDGESIWSETVPLAANASTGDSPTTVRTTVDIDQVDARLAEVIDEVGGAATVHAYLRHDLTYRVDGETNERTEAVELRVSQSSYRLTGDLGGPVRTTETVPTSRPDPGRTTVMSVAGETVIVPTTASWSLGIGLLALVGAALAGLERRREPDPRAISRELERLRFAEWISTANVDVADADARVPVASLADLVDIAIDSNRRVIHDPTTGHYVVTVDGIAYTYARDGRATTAPAAVDREETVATDREETVAAAETPEPDDEAATDPSTGAGTDRIERFLQGGMGDGEDSDDDASAEETGARTDETPRSGATSEGESGAEPDERSEEGSAEDADAFVFPDR
ncbi:hypothetical protein GCM10027435_01210 [Haloparvum alkalitolerans]